MSIQFTMSSRQVIFGLFVIVTLQLSSVVTLAADKSATESGAETFGYVAEWGYEGPGHLEDTLEESVTTAAPSLFLEPDAGTLYPSKRVGPGTWLDDQGSWWLFGGQGPNVYNPNPSRPNESLSIEFLSDLWVYDATTSPTPAWRPIFRPLRHDKTPLSSYPDYLPFPTLCGSRQSKHVAVFGGDSMSNSPSESDAPFSDDNIVWLYDIPNCKSGDFVDGLWTSYICCDACLPDENTTLEFCPHFAEEHKASRQPPDPRPILWCSTDSLMALQLNPNPKAGLDDERRDKPRPPEDPSDSGAGISSAGTSSKEGTTSSPSHQINSSPEKPGPFLRNSQLNWWKFDLGATEWEKMRGVSIGFFGKPSVVDLTQIFQPDCRHVSDQTLVYILCPRDDAPLLRDLFVFDPEVAEIKLTGSLKLNNAFQEPRMWAEGRSVLSALRHENKTILFLAYQKLLDLWLLDHELDQLTPLENVWKGASLHIFQHTTSFYKLLINFPNSTALPFFMPNPRTKLFRFQDDHPLSTFTIRVEPDKSVFLPARDAPMLMSKPLTVEASTKPELQEASTVASPVITVPSRDNHSSLELGSGTKAETELDSNLRSSSSSQEPPRDRKPNSTMTFQSESGGESQNKTFIGGIDSSPSTTPASQSSTITSQEGSATNEPQVESSTMPVSSTPSHDGTTIEAVSAKPCQTCTDKTTPKPKRRANSKYHTKRENSAEPSHDFNFADLAMEVKAQIRTPPEVRIEPVADNEDDEVAIPMMTKSNPTTIPTSGFGESNILVDGQESEQSLSLDLDLGPDDGLGPGLATSGPEYSTFGSLLFFTLSISFFCAFGVVLFIRNCVKCPPRRQSVLLKEPPPIRYSVIPDEQCTLVDGYHHVPIV